MLLIRLLFQKSQPDHIHSLYHALAKCKIKIFFVFKRLNGTIQWIVFTADWPKTNQFEFSELITEFLKYFIQVKNQINSNQK